MESCVCPLHEPKFARAQEKADTSENHNSVTSPTLHLNFHTKKSGDFLGRQPGKRHENLITWKKGANDIDLDKKGNWGQRSSFSP